MRSSSQSIDSQRLCAKFRINLNKLENEKGQVIREIHRQRERVGTSKGKISIVENELSTLLANARDLANGAGSLGVNTLRHNATGAAKDVTQLAISLSNAAAKQRAEIRRLQYQLEGAKEIPKSGQDEQAGIQSQIKITVDFMRANDCLG